MIPLSWYLIVAALLFSIGAYGMFARRNAVGILMAVELMLNAVNINLVAFWRYRELLDPNPNMPFFTITSGWAWAIFVLTVAAAEAAVGLALIISVYRRRDSVVAEELDLLKN
ncbi:MAG: NADH-quinone oxidoreductase subunit NuoK [Chloroflexi bacterium]|nr:NADH-quinone oxidoreductase subunit NuoK [Chloroflexota bacterium]